MLAIGTLLDCCTLVMQLRRNVRGWGNSGFGAVPLACYLVAVASRRPVLIDVGNGVLSRVLLALGLWVYHLSCTLLIPLWHDRWLRQRAPRVPGSQGASPASPERLRIARSNIAQILAEMEQLLRRVRAYERANYLEDLISELDSDPRAAIRKLAGLDFWGGSGSFRDLLLYEPYHVSDDFDRDNAALQRVLLRLLEELERLQYVSGGWVRREKRTLASTANHYEHYRQR